MYAHTTLQFIMAQGCSRSVDVETFMMSLLLYKTEKSLKMKRDVGMACQKLSNILYMKLPGTEMSYT